MNYLSLKLRIKKNEGFSSRPYKDQLGNYTIGYGHLIRKKEIILFKKNFKVSFFQNLFENDFKTALDDYNKHFRKYSFSQNIKELIVEMIFQLGGRGVSKFRKMWAALREDPPNYFEAHVQMLDSRWAKQTPARAVEMAEQMQNAE